MFTPPGGQFVDRESHSQRKADSSPSQAQGRNDKTLDVPPNNILLSLLLTFDNSPRLITLDLSTSERRPRGRTNGPAPRHPGPAHPENAGTGANAWLGHRAAYPANIQEVLQVGQGSLYPALQRLETRGWITAEWSMSDNNRRAKFYSLTSTGRRQLAKELGEWAKLSSAIALILGQEA